MTPANSLEKLKNLWPEKYRPDTIEDFVISTEMHEKVNEWVKDKQIPHLLFSGSPGIGKTTLAKLIGKLLNCTIHYINASDESGIDTVRTRIMNIARTKSRDGMQKLVILDEIDRFTKDAQDGLRNVMETYAPYVRFILTCNYQHKLTTALQSRCEFYDLTPDKKQFAERILHIIDSENIEVSDDQYELLKTVLRVHYPDFRKTINVLSSCTRKNKLDIKSIYAIDMFAEKLFTKLQKQTNVLDIREFIIHNEHVFHNNYEQLLISLYDYIHSERPVSDEKVVEMLISIDEYIYRGTARTDKEINFFTCVLELKRIM